MKRHVITAAAALSLLCGTSAFAQDHDNNSGHPSGGPSHGGAPGGPHGGAPGGPSGGPKGGPTGGPSGGSHTFGGSSNTSHVSGSSTNVRVVTPPSGGATHFDRHNTGGPSNGSNTFQSHQTGGPNNGSSRQGNGSHFTGAAQGHPGWGGPQSSANGHGRSYNPSWFPHQITPRIRFHWRGAWTAQPGYSYRQWSYGQYLPRGWWGPQWYVDDYYDYDLPPPPWGYEWVRVGPDALLINDATGMIVEVVPGLFD